MKRSRANAGMKSGGGRVAKRRTRPPTSGPRVPLSRVERKAVDIGSTTSNISTTVDVSLLNGIAPGTGVNQRIGRKVQIRSTFITGFVYPEAAAPTPIVNANNGVQYIRLMLVWDKQPNAATFAQTDLFTTNSLAHSQLNLDNKDRFIILKDKRFTFDPFFYKDTATQSLAGMSKCSMPIKWYVKLNKETQFNGGSAGTIADITTGALFFVKIGSLASGAAVDANMAWTARTRFTDL